MLESLRGLWPADTDLSFQFLLTLIGQPLANLTGIGDAGGRVTLATVAFTALGPWFWVLAGLYIVLRTVKGIVTGAFNPQWARDEGTFYSLIGPVIGFLCVIPLTPLGGYTLAHSGVMYAGVTSIGLGNWLADAVVDAYGEHPLVTPAARKTINPVAAQVGLTMLQAHLCLAVINELEGTALGRREETFSREQPATRVPLSALPGINPALPGGRPAFDPIVQQAAATWGVPPTLIHAVIRQESGYDPTAVSSAGAQGLMQLMPATADRFGVRDPFDPRQNILGGTAYLAWLLNRYDGDVARAVGAYNCGEGCMDRVLAGERELPAETGTYVERVLGFYGAALAAVPDPDRVGTLHVRRVQWGGPPYAQNLCGEIEYPYAYTVGAPRPAEQLQGTVLTQREIRMTRLETEIAALARAMLAADWSPAELGDRLIDAIMRFDISLHAEALRRFDDYSGPAVDEYLQAIRDEGWVILGEVFTRLAELQNAVDTGASYGIRPRALVRPEAYLSRQTGGLLTAYLARIDALLDRALRGSTEAERLALARAIAAENGLEGLASEVGRYSATFLRWGILPANGSTRLTDRRREILAQSAQGDANEGSVLRTVIRMITDRNGQYPLLRYQELGKTLLAGGSIGKVGGGLLPEHLGGALVGALGTIALIIGFLLAVFLPLLPQVIWTIAVFTWVLNFVVLFALAPVWAVFHVNLRRAKTGWFVLLRFLLMALFLVMMFIASAALLMVFDRVIDWVIVTPLMRYAQQSDYILAIGGLMLYALMVIAASILALKVPIDVLSRIYTLVRADVPRPVTVEYDRLLARRTV